MPCRKQLGYWIENDVIRQASEGGRLHLTLSDRKLWAVVQGRGRAFQVEGGANVLDGWEESKSSVVFELRRWQEGGAVSWRGGPSRCWKAG